MSYPENDDDFEDKVIDKVEEYSAGRYAITCDGWGLHCGEQCPVKPLVGQIARMYPKIVGGMVRGLFIDGVKIWYRTEAEQKEYHEIELYGADAKDWLKRWDEGQGVWSIEMGGLGPGYEQCIQITAAEVLRWFISHNCDASRWDDSAHWQADREKMSKELFECEALKDLGLSGAQFGAAVQLGAKLYMKGPRGIMADDQVKDRHIQVSKNFPGMRAA